MSRRYICWYGSERKTNKGERRLVKAALKRGEEPEPKYHTRKFWVD